MLLDEPGTFHPYAFCQMFKAGNLDPWEDLRWMMERLTGVKDGGLPSKAPRVRDLPLPVSHEQIGGER